MEFSNLNIDLGGHEIDFRDFYITENSLNAIIGVSGKGKTTLLKYLHGTFSETPILPSCFVSAENYFLYKKVLSNFSISEKNFRSNYEILFEEDLDFFKDHLVNDLSFGQKTRFKILRSSLTNYDFIMYDEPTHGLDPYSVEKVLKFFESLKKRKTIIVTTHEQGLIENADNVIKL